jgi:LuxR family transcriptional activator of bioluminescence operon
MNLCHFAACLEQVTDLQQAEIILNSYLSSFNFRYYAFTYYSGHIKSGQKLRYHYVSTALRPWHMHYLEQTYADVDRTLEESHLSTFPLLWDVGAQLAQAKNKREQRIRQESIEFGIDKGLSMPIHGPNHDFVTLTLHQCRGEACLSNYQEQQFIWLSAAYIFYHCVRKIIDAQKVSVTPYQLTKREEQCLALTAKSWRVEQIAKELKISARTVNFHIQNANKKLGANNKYQATYKYFELVDDAV